MSTKPDTVFQDIFEHSSIPIYLMDTQSRILSSNQAFERLIGYDPEELENVSLKSLVHKDDWIDPEIFFPSIQSAGPEGIRLECRMNHKDGTELWTEVFTSAVMDQDENIQYIIVIIQDRTESKITEREIREKSADLTLINDVNSIINEPGKLENVYARIGHWLFQEFDCNGFIASHTDDDLKTIEVNYLIFSEEIMGLVPRKSDNDESKITLRLIKDSTLEQIITRQQPVYVDYSILRKIVNKKTLINAGQWSLRDIFGIITNIGKLRSIKYMGIVPLIADNTVHATFHFFSGVPFTDEQKLRINTISQQAAGIIRRKFAVDSSLIHRKKLMQLSQQLLQLQEEEKKNLALELHDDFGQMLTAMRINVSKVLVGLKGHNDSGIIEKLKDTIGMIDTSEESIRDLSLLLRPTMLDELGLYSSLEWYIGQYRKRNEISVNLNFNLHEAELDDDQEIIFYRIVQEALTNISRHANAENVTINIDKIDEDMYAVIRDDGVGFDYEEVMETKLMKTSAGLVGMEERLQILNGKLYIKTNPGEGTEVQITIPLNRPEELHGNH